VQHTILNRQLELLPKSAEHQEALQPAPYLQTFFNLFKRKTGGHRQGKPDSASQNDKGGLPEHQGPERLHGLAEQGDIAKEQQIRGQEAAVAEAEPRKPEPAKKTASGETLDENGRRFAVLCFQPDTEEADQLERE